MDRHEEWIVRVALDQPTPTLFEYRYATAHKPQAGQLAHVPFGRRMETGLIWGIVSQSALPLARLREVEAIWHVCPPLSAKWRALLQFAADYYQRGLGEIALPALPGALRDTRRWPRLSAHLHNAQQAQPAGAAATQYGTRVCAFSVAWRDRQRQNRGLSAPAHRFIRPHSGCTGIGACT